MIKYGNNDIGKLYFGNNSIGKAYLGSNLVFERGSSPTSPLVYYDRLVFDGIAYIETTYSLPANSSMRYIVGNETRKASQSIFSVLTNGYYVAMLFGGLTNTTQRQIVAWYDSTSYLKEFLENRLSDSLSLFITPKCVGYGSNSYSFTKGGTHPTGGIRFGIGQNPYTGELGTFYVYGSDAQNVTTYDGFDSFTPVATLRPCTYNGTPGLWYVEGGTFWGNTAGSGTLSVRNIE